jgi:DNA-binding transcriptional LysR family regulator
MEWNDLKVFLAAVRAGSYTAAGRQLGVNRTTVGRRIDALETTLGVELFQETPSGPVPTREGESLLRAAAAVESEIDTLLGALGRADRPQAPVRIASSAGIAYEFLSELGRFQQEETGVAVELLGEIDPVDAVTHRRADLAIAILRVPPQRLAAVEIATLRQANYGLRGMTGLKRLGWGNEVDHAIPGQWTTANPAGEATERGEHPAFNNWPQLKGAVLAGLGSASLWCFAGDAETSLERLGPSDPRHDYPLWLLRRAKAPPGPGLERLITFLTAALRARLVR